MHTGLLHLHSFLRWAVVILIILAIIKAITKYSSGLEKGGIKVALFALIATHLQLIVGFGLYFISPIVKAALSDDGMMKNAMSRFWAVEHVLTMLISVVLITIGYATAKRAKTDVKRARKLFWFYLIGFILMMSAIPWPIRAIGAGRGWF